MVVIDNRLIANAHSYCLSQEAKQKTSNRFNLHILNNPAPILLTCRRRDGDRGARCLLLRPAGTEPVHVVLGGGNMVTQSH